MDLEVVMKSNDCPYIVQFYGAIFKEVGYSMQMLMFIECQLCYVLVLVYHLL